MRLKQAAARIIPEIAAGGAAIAVWRDGASWGVDSITPTPDELRRNLADVVEIDPYAVILYAAYALAVVVIVLIDALFILGGNRGDDAAACHGIAELCADSGIV